MALKIGKIKHKPGVALIGSFFTHNNYALFNRNIAQQFLLAGQFETGLHQDDDFNRSSGALSALLESRLGRVPAALEYQIFHQSLPQLEAPEVGKWVLFQPWEYGSMPKDWQEHFSLSADDIWVHTQYNKDCYVREGIAEERVAVIPVGVNPEIFDPATAPARLPTQKSFKFLFVGESMWYSGLDLVLKAFTEEFLADENVSLIVKDFKSASANARKANLDLLRELQQNPDNPEIIYVDRDMTENEMASLYRACDCLVYPYRAEAFGQQVLEAMACGVPVLMTQWEDNLGVGSEAFNHFISARQIKHIDKQIGGFDTLNFPLWVEPNFAELRYKMREATEEYSEWQQRAIKASQQVRTHHTWKQSYDAIAARLEVLKEKPLYRMQQAQIQHLILQGLEAMEQGDGVAAWPFLEQALAADPHNGVIHLDMGTIKLKQGEYEQALAYFEKALRQNPSNANIYSVLGIALFHLGEHALARQFFQKTLALAPDHQGASESMAIVEQLIRNKPKKKRDTISPAYQPYVPLLQLIRDPESRKTLSLCMIVKNEEQFLRQCLESVKEIVDDIVIVDTGSTDGTLEIAEEYGANIQHFEWNGSFSDARNEALKYATSDWVLILDADETVSPDSLHNIRELMAVPQTQLTGFQLKIRNFNQMDNDVDVVEHYTLRLFPNTPLLHFTGVIHEQVQPVDPDVVFDRLASPDVLLLHYGYTGQIMTERDKQHRNLELIERSIKEEPDSPFHYFNLALTLRVTHRDEEALEAFKKAVELAEKLEHMPTYMSANYSYMASIYISMDNYTEAEELCKNAPEMCHSNPDFWVNYGTIYNGLGQYDKAIEMFKKAMAMRSKPFTSLVADRASTTWKPYAGIGNSYLLNKDLDMASFYFRRALKENPKNRDIQLGLARLAMFQNKLEDAEKYYLELFEKAPDERFERVIRTDLGNLYFKMGKLKEASAMIEPLEASREVTDTIANLYYQAGKFQEIIDLYNGLLEKGEPQLNDYRNRGIAYYSLKEYDKAQADFESALQIEPNDAESLHNLGALALSREDVALAESFYQKALAADPELFDPYFDMGKVRSYQENFEDARAYLLKAFDLNPKHVPMLQLLASVEQTLGNIGDASERLLDVLDINPDNSETLSQLGYLMMNAGELERALQLFERALAQDDKDAGIYTGIGLTFMQAEKYEDARNAFLVAYQLKPGDPEIERAIQVADQLCGFVPV